MSKDKTLRLEGISKVFGHDGSAGGVRQVDFEVRAGEGFSLLGPSGCGKTTTLRIIGGFEQPATGSLFHGTTNITNLPPQKRNIRTVFQKYALFPHMGVEDNIAFGLRMQKRPKAEIAARVKAIAELIEISHLFNREVRKLSGGEQQRVALARALITEPDVLLLDEPLSALDLKLRERMQLELLTLRKKLGSTFIFVTHDQTEAMTLSDRIAVMNKGQIVQIGQPEEIYLRPNSKFVATFIGQANFFSADLRAVVKGATELMPTIKSDQEFMVRPEHLITLKAGAAIPARHLAIQGRIIETVFLGADRITKAEVFNNQAIMIRTPGFEPPIGHTNDAIQVGWDVEDTWVINKN